MEHKVYGMENANKIVVFEGSKIEKYISALKFHEYEDPTIMERECTPVSKIYS